MHPQRHLIHHDRHDHHHHDDHHDHQAQYHGEVKGICRYVQLIREGGQAVSCKESLRGKSRKSQKVQVT